MMGCVGYRKLYKECALMENMKGMSELEKRKLEIIVLKKKVAFLDGIIEGLVKG